MNSSIVSGVISYLLIESSDDLHWLRTSGCAVSKTWLACNTSLLKKLAAVQVASSSDSSLPHFVRCTVSKSRLLSVVCIHFRRPHFSRAISSAWRGQKLRHGHHDNSK
jgi:hypothetical protein